MLQYLLNEEYRQAHKFISSIGFVSSQACFKNVNYQKLRAMIRGEENCKGVGFFEQCFQVMAAKKNKPKEMIKLLVFIHLLLQTGNPKSEEMLALLNKQINSVIIKSKEYCESKHKAVMAPSMSLVSVMTEEDHDDEVNAGQLKSHSDISQGSHSSKISQSSSIVSDLSQNNSTTPSDAGKHDYATEKQIICDKLIEPYACYLLKKCTSDFDSDKSMDVQLLVWHEINSLKCLLNITQNYYTIMRYYDRKYFRIVIKLTTLLSHDIHCCYPKLTRAIKNKLDGYIAKLCLKGRERNVMGNKENNMENGGKGEVEGLTEIKELLKEVGVINDALIYFYMNKYISEYLRKLNIRMPELMSLDTMECEMIYFQIQEQDKKVEKELKKAEIVRKCRQNMENVGLFIKRPKNMGTDMDCLSPFTPNYETMTPNRIPRSGLRKKNSSNLPLKQNKYSSKRDIMAQVDDPVPSRIQELEEERD